MTRSFDMRYVILRIIILPNIFRAAVISVMFWEEIKRKINSNKRQLNNTNLMKTYHSIFHLRTSARGDITHTLHIKVLEIFGRKSEGFPSYDHRSRQYILKLLMSIETKKLEGTLISISYRAFPTFLSLNQVTKNHTFYCIFWYTNIYDFP